MIELGPLGEIETPTRVFAKSEITSSSDAQLTTISTNTCVESVELIFFDHRTIPFPHEEVHSRNKHFGTNFLKDRPEMVCAFYLSNTNVTFKTVIFI